MSVVAKPGNGRPAASSPPGPVEDEGARIPPVPFEHEELVVRRGTRSGRQMAVAVHSTALGPALGGVRLWHYPAPTDAARDALRLARGMTMKAAAAGLALGGGKGVICSGSSPPTGAERRDALLDFADLVESLDGRYITAEDVGICPEDLVTIRERTGHVTGLPPEHGGSGDPSPLTALGVEAAIRACARERLGSPGLAGLRVVIVGLGHVGERLARRLAEDGARLAVADIDERKQAATAGLGAQWLDPHEAMLAECDVLAPCALGGAVDAANLPLLRCRVICGSANNQLADEALDEALAKRGILYAPDFIANAGGLINVYREIRGYSEDEARELVRGIEETMDRILAGARERSITPLRAAGELALGRLQAAGVAA